MIEDCARGTRLSRSGGADLPRVRLSTFLRRGFSATMQGNPITIHHETSWQLTASKLLYWWLANEAFRKQVLGLW